jgi:hypothetical protein
VNAQQQSWSFRSRACPKCGGDAFFDRGDEQEWRCLQCARPLVQARSVMARANLQAGDGRGTSTEGIEGILTSDSKRRQAI